MLSSRLRALVMPTIHTIVTAMSSGGVPEGLGPDVDGHDRHRGAALGGEADERVEVQQVVQQADREDDDRRDRHDHDVTRHIGTERPDGEGSDRDGHPTQVGDVVAAHLRGAGPVDEPGRQRQSAQGDREEERRQEGSHEEHGPPGDQRVSLSRPEQATYQFAVSGPRARTAGGCAAPRLAGQAPTHGDAAPPRTRHAATPTWPTRPPRPRPPPPPRARRASPPRRARRCAPRRRADATSRGARNVSGWPPNSGLSFHQTSRSSIASPRNRALPAHQGSSSSVRIHRRTTSVRPTSAHRSTATPMMPVSARNWMYRLWTLVTPSPPTSR